MLTLTCGTAAALLPLPSFVRLKHLPIASSVLTVTCEMTGDSSSTLKHGHALTLQHDDLTCLLALHENLSIFET